MYMTDKNLRYCMSAGTLFHFVFALLIFAYIYFVKSQTTLGKYINCLLYTSDAADE